MSKEELRQLQQEDQTLATIGGSLKKSTKAEFGDVMKRMALYTSDGSHEGTVRRLMPNSLFYYNTAVGLC